MHPLFLASHARRRTGQCNEYMHLLCWNSVDRTESIHHGVARGNPLFLVSVSLTFPPFFGGIARVQYKGKDRGSIGAPVTLGGDRYLSPPSQEAIGQAENYPMLASQTSSKHRKIITSQRSFHWKIRKSRETPTVSIMV